MATEFEFKERRLIPNWRDFKRTVQLGELESSNTLNKFREMSIADTISDWKTDNNIGTAADLINASYITGIFDDEITPAIKYVIQNSGKSSKSLIGVAEIISSESLIDKISSGTLLEKDYEHIEEFNTLINNKLLYKLINKTKNKTKNEIFDPITWIELGRLYAMVGNFVKAENAIMTALHLAPNNRFVLRSATRFFIHVEDYDKALFYLKNAASLKKDPWLISAHIATSSLLKRYSPVIKEGIALTTSNNFSNFALTELSSSLGTLEFGAGSFKSAKKFFEKSMLAPNDNSLAQLEWISKYDTRLKINLDDHNDVVNPFEAYAIDQYLKGNWKDAFNNCLKWFLDMPFSKRPILLGSYIAGSMLNDIEAALTLCKVGLQANPHHYLILNNIIYYNAVTNQLTSVEPYIAQLKHLYVTELLEAEKIVVNATLGLVSFRKQEFEEGKRLYEAAIQGASKLKNEVLKNSATINFTRELIISNQPEKIGYVQKTKNLDLSNNKNLAFLRDGVLDLFAKQEKI